jgi:hypothetical protein
VVTLASWPATKHGTAEVRTGRDMHNKDWILFRVRIRKGLDKGNYEDMDKPVACIRQNGKELSGNGMRERVMACALVPGNPVRTDTRGLEIPD